MEQGETADNDDLPQLRANLTEAVQTLLTDVNKPQEAFLQRFAEAHFASHTLSQALLRVVPQISMELGEAYTQEATVLPASTSFLCTALMEFRRRKGINF